MARARVTLRDVARRVGVHPSTVSRVLNPETRSMVGEAIARRVTVAAKALGYHPNPIAYSLKTNRSLIVGVLVPDLTNPVFPPIIRGIEDVLSAAGYTAILANSDNDAARERMVADKMLARRVDGLILATARRRDPLVAHCLAEDIPIILINRTVEGGRVPFVVNDDALGIDRLVAHMVSCGHARIAHIAGPLGLSTGFARRQAFIAAMKTRGLQVDPRLIVPCAAFSEAEGRRAFRALREQGGDVTAVVTGNDLLALGCYDAAAELGIRIPEDISITGYNDMPFLDKLRPPLTTMRIPHYQMGAEAARMLLARMQNRKAHVRSLKLEPELVVRGSTAPPRTDARMGSPRRRLQ